MLENGKRYIVAPETMIGLDGNPYTIITYYGAGRDWAGKMYYHLLKPRQVVVEVIEKQRDIPNLYEVAIVKGGRQLVREFSKRPYVRKDGTFTVLHDLDYEVHRTLQDQYSTSEIESVEKLEEHIARVRKQGMRELVPYFQELLKFTKRYPHLVGKYKVHMYIKPKQATLTTKG